MNTKNKLGIHFVGLTAKEIALLGVELSAIALIFLLIGQRLAKDYAGAMSLGVYFIIPVGGVFLLK